MPQIRVLFIDSNAAFRRLAIHALSRHFPEDIALVGEADSWPLAAPPLKPPHAILLGLGAEGLANPQLLAPFQMALPGVPVVILGHLDDPAYREVALASGAAAFVSKDALSVELIPALRRITGP